SLDRIYRIEQDWLRGVIFSFILKNPVNPVKRLPFASSLFPTTHEHFLQQTPLPRSRSRADLGDGLRPGVTQMPARRLRRAGELRAFARSLPDGRRRDFD